MKITAIAPSNIAFIKYWGKKDEELKLPENGSISMNLSNLLTTTTVEFNPGLKNDEVLINGQSEEKKTKRVITHLDRVRSLAKIQTKAKVVSVNNFPTGTGLSSSASGFAALTLAASAAAGLKLTEKELSILARLGSGSACRSIPDGFIEWLDGNTNETSYATSLFPPIYWDIVDIVGVVSSGPKDIPTSEGQKLAQTSPFFGIRKKHINEKIKSIKKYLKEKNFACFGELIETEALELHAVMLTSVPSLIYWLPGTVQVMKYVHKWRKEGIMVYFTLNTGQDVHIICQKKDAEKILKLIKEIPEVKKVIPNYPAKGTSFSENHLF